MRSWELLLGGLIWGGSSAREGSVGLRVSGGLPGDLILAFHLEGSLSGFQPLALGWSSYWLWAASAIPGSPLNTIKGRQTYNNLKKISPQISRWPLVGKFCHLQKGKSPDSPSLSPSLPSTLHWEPPDCAQRRQEAENPYVLRAAVRKHTLRPGWCRSECLKGRWFDSKLGYIHGWMIRAQQEPCFSLPPSLPPLSQICKAFLQVGF